MDAELKKVYLMLWMNIKFNNDNKTFYIFILQLCIHLFVQKIQKKKIN